MINLILQSRASLKRSFRPLNGRINAHLGQTPILSMARAASGTDEAFWEEMLCKENMSAGRHAAHYMRVCPAKLWVSLPGTAKFETWQGVSDFGRVSLQKVKSITTGEAQHAGLVSSGGGGNAARGPLRHSQQWSNAPHLTCVTEMACDNSEIIKQIWKYIIVREE